MSLQVINHDIQENLKKNRQKNKFFPYEISYRFSDCIYEHHIHFSKFFEFFEMARFDVMTQFMDFYQKKTKSKEQIDLGNFVVIRIQSEMSEAIEKSLSENIQIKTNLFVHHKPLLEFQQIAYCQKEKLLEAKVKVVLVDEKMHKVEDWDLDILSAILEFIEEKGREACL